MPDYRYGDLKRIDSLFEKHTIQGYRPANVSKVARELEEANRKIDEAIAKSKEIKNRIIPICTHAIEDLVCTEFGIDDTYGKHWYSVRYLTCKLCGKEIWRSKNE